MFASVRINGQNEEGIPILELNLGERSKKSSSQDAPEEEENVLQSIENENGPPVDERDCRYCIILEDFEDLISPCGCRGSLRY